jgi:carboxymethylenebutenolidase
LKQRLCGAAEAETDWGRWTVPPTGNEKLEVTVEATVRIKPRLSEVVSRGRRVPVASVLLGGVPRGAVILLSAAGEPPANIAEVMNRLAEHGYESVSADLAAANGDQVPDDGDIVGDVHALAEKLADRGWSKEQIGLVGYGYGGRAALLAAASGAFGAAVSVEPAIGEQPPVGSCSTGAWRGLRTPWLGLFAVPKSAAAGEAGRLAWLSALQRALRLSSPVHTQVVAYPGVPSTYYRDSHVAATHAAAFDTWQRVVEWLNLRVAPRPTLLAEAWQARQSARKSAASDVGNREVESC